MSEIFVERARSLVGCRFRPQGRDPSFGLDCIGLVCATFAIPESAVGREYRLRGGSWDRLSEELARFFKPVRAEAAIAGDVILMRVAEDQPHLAVLSPRGFVHADARLRRVVETPGQPQWPLISAHRRKGF